MSDLEEFHNLERLREMLKLLSKDQIAYIRAESVDKILKEVIDLLCDLRREKRVWKSIEAETGFEMGVGQSIDAIIKLQSKVKITPTLSKMEKVAPTCKESLQVKPSEGG